MTTTTLLITSIAPPFKNGGINHEKLNWTNLCISSWHRSGHQVVSVNTRSEIDVVRKMFPKVRFIETLKSTKPINNRPLVFIYDALTLVKNEGHTRFAICNGDVIISCNISGIDIPDESCLYSSRIDIDDDKSVAGKLFPGIDYFNFDNIYLEKMIPNYFAFGLPWWDYWLPLQAKLLNMDLHRLTTHEGAPILLHKKHREAWNPNDLCNMGRYFLELMHYRKDLHHNEVNFINSYISNPSPCLENTILYASIARDVCSHIHSLSKKIVVN
jgi:hypothetical protein